MNLLSKKLQSNLFYQKALFLFSNKFKITNTFVFLLSIVWSLPFLIYLPGAFLLLSAVALWFTPSTFLSIFGCFLFSLGVLTVYASHKLLGLKKRFDEISKKFNPIIGLAPVKQESFDESEIMSDKEFFEMLLEQAATGKRTIH